MTFEMYAKHNFGIVPVCTFSEFTLDRLVAFCRGVRKYRPNICEGLSIYVPADAMAEIERTHPRGWFETPYIAGIPIKGRASL
jgi:hypothetical protein